jgi:WD40 repeat protein
MSDIASVVRAPALRWSWMLDHRLSGHTGVVESVAFRPGSGLILASGSDDETIRLWNLDVSEAINRICAAGRNNLTAAQRHTYIPQLPYQPPCTH